MQSNRRKVRASAHPRSRSPAYRASRLASDGGHEPRPAGEISVVAYAAKSRARSPPGTETAPLPTSTAAPTLPARRRAPQQSSPAGRSSRAATRRPPDRVQPVVPGEQGQRGSWSRASGATERRPPGGCRAGWRSPGRLCRRARPGRPPCRHVQLDQGVGQVAPAYAAASGDDLDGVDVEPGSARWRSPWRSPRSPVHSSTTTGGAPACERSSTQSSIAQPVITSVSGRGTNTPGPTSTSMAEVGAAGQVLQRNPGCPLVDQLVEPAHMIIVQLVNSGSRAARHRRRTTAGSARPAPGRSTPAAASRAAAAASNGRTAAVTGPRRRPGRAVPPCRPPAAR